MGLCQKDGSFFDGEGIGGAYPSQNGSLDLVFEDMVTSRLRETGEGEEWW